MTTDILDLTKATVPVGADALYLATGIVGKTGTDQHILLTDLFDNMVNNKNVIINGDMEISQRGTSFAAVANGDYCLDRFTYGKVGTMVHTITQDTDVPTLADTGHTSKHSLKVDCTTIDATIAAGDVCKMDYKVEGYDYFPLVGKTVTLSFKVKATKIGIYCVSFTNANSDRSYIVEYEVLVTDTWENKTVTVLLDETGGTWDYINGVGVNINFALACGSTFHAAADAWQTGLYFATSNQVNACDSTDNNFWLSQVKLEIGSGATDFVSRPYAEELALCKRYCILVASGLGYIGLCFYDTTVRIKLGVYFEVEMRATPTVIATSGTDYYRASGLGGNDYMDSLIASGGSERFMSLSNDSDVSGTPGLTLAMYCNKAASNILLTAEL